MTRWEPFETMVPLRDAVTRLLEDSYSSLGRSEFFGHTMPVNIHETETSYLVEAALPGFKPEEVTVTATDEVVTIRAIHKPVDEEKKGAAPGAYVRREHYRGEIYRALGLPSPILFEQVRATYEHGILTLDVPKAARVEPKAIPITVKEAVTEKVTEKVPEKVPEKVTEKVAEKVTA